MRTEMSTSDTEEEYDWNHFQNDWKKNWQPEFIEYKEL